MGKKRRRISFLSGAKIERFSIIPKLEKSSIDDDDDVDDDNHFEVIDKPIMFYNSPLLLHIIIIS